MGTAVSRKATIPPDHKRIVSVDTKLKLKTFTRWSSELMKWEQTKQLKLALTTNFNQSRHYPHWAEIRFSRSLLCHHFATNMHYRNWQMNCSKQSKVAAMKCFSTYSIHTTNIWDQIPWNWPTSNHGPEKRTIDLLAYRVSVLQVKAVLGFPPFESRSKSDAPCQICLIRQIEHQVNNLIFFKRVQIQKLYHLPRISSRTCIGPKWPSVLKKHRTNTFHVAKLGETSSLTIFWR